MTVPLIISDGTPYEGWYSLGNAVGLNYPDKRSCLSLSDAYYAGGITKTHMWNFNTGGNYTGTLYIKVGRVQGYKDTIIVGEIYPTFGGERKPFPPWGSGPDYPLPGWHREIIQYSWPVSNISLSNIGLSAWTDTDDMFGHGFGIYYVGFSPPPPPYFEIETLPATEVWATGATIHGLLHNNITTPWYGYMGFQWGLTSPADGGYINWLYSGYHNRIGHLPIQATISGLLPDRTYYYRACLHVGTPPMNVGNYFGSTLSFGGPVSIFGHGWEYVTAKKAEDDVSKLAAGRYYMDKSGNFVYESAKHRIVP